MYLGNEDYSKLKVKVVFSITKTESTQQFLFFIFILTIIASHALQHGLTMMVLFD